MRLPFGWKDSAALPALADACGLDCNDPQIDALIRPGEAAARGFRGDPVDAVRGWVNEDNVVRLMAQISGHIGYSYDDLDEAALTGALDGTDDESPDGWFQYPLEGIPALMVHLAQSPGSAVVSVRVEGNMDFQAVPAAFHDPGAVSGARVEFVSELVSRRVGSVSGITVSALLWRASCSGR